MWKVLALLALALAVNCDPNPLLDKLTNRQKRLLFFDEQGSLVQTYANPNLHGFGQYTETKNPSLLNFLNPLYNIIRPNTFGSSIVYTVPISEAVLRQLYIDPLFHNKLIVLPTRNPHVELSLICAGKRTQIPSPKLCSSFLNCWDGWAWEQDCPAGLLFSNDGYCDYPYNVDCKQRLLKVEPKPLCNKDFETFKNNVNCQEFFVCVHRLPIRFQCPEELAYNEILGICDYPSKVQCNITHVFSNTPTPVTLEVSTLTSIDASTSSATPDNLTMTEQGNKSQSWKTIPVARSRQDAINHLGQFDHIHTGY